MSRGRPAPESRSAHPRRRDPDSRSAHPFIEVEKARQNNLKDVSVRIPIGAVTPVTGLAGEKAGLRRVLEKFHPTLLA
jgi:excinuclease UvrABC ATPase subunit